MNGTLNGDYVGIAAELRKPMFANPYGGGNVFTYAADAIESLVAERDALRAQLDAARAVMRQYENWYDGAPEDSWRLQRDMMAVLDMQEME